MNSFFCSLTQLTEKYNPNNAIAGPITAQAPAVYKAIASKRIKTSSSKGKQVSNNPIGTAILTTKGITEKIFLAYIAFLALLVYFA